MSNLPTNKLQWLEQRRGYITGTDLAAIMGLSPFAGPMSVWLDKKGLSEPVKETPAMRMGLRMESAILGIYSEETGEALDRADPYELAVSKDGLIAASLDARHRGNDRRPVDAKNIRVFDPKKWGDPGTSDIPKHYHLQLAAQMMATETRLASLAVLFSGQEFRAYTIERDKELDEAVTEFARGWWQKHIINGDPPDADGSDATSRYISEKLARAEKGLVIESTPEIEGFAAKIKECKSKAAEIEAEQKAAENALKLLIGDAEEVPGVLTWKNNRDSVKTDWEAIAKAANAPMELIQQFTKTTPGARVLRLK